MRILRSFAAAILVLAGLSLPAGAWAEDPTGTGSSVSDTALLDALAEVGLLDAWYEASPHGPAVSGMVLSGGASMEELRASVIADAQTLAESRGDELRLLGSIESLEGTIADLEALARTLRELQVTEGPTLAPDEARRLQKTLLHARGEAGQEPLEDTVDLIEQVREKLDRALVEAQVGDQTGGDADKNRDVRELSGVLADLDGLYVQLDVLRSQALVTTDEEAALLVRLTESLPALHELRRSATTPIDGLPAVTLDAYTRAGEWTGNGCGVDWSLLAGIGRIESFHGTLGDSVVRTTGAVSPHIFGPLLDGGATEREAAEALEAEIAAQEQAEAEEAARIAAEEERKRRELFGDPTPTPTPTPLFPEPTPTLSDEESESDEDEPRGNGFAVIEDTDEGEIDGNPRWDRAVGPMQFIPGTWARWATDGNGDGITDPHNLYDAAFSAAAYLCHLERRSGPSPWNYVLGYNASSSYVADVMSTASRLGNIELPTVPTD